MALAWQYCGEYDERVGMDHFWIAEEGKARFVICSESVDGHFPASNYWLYVYLEEADMKGSHGEYVCEEFDAVEECQTVAEEYAEEIREGTYMRDGSESGEK